MCVCLKDARVRAELMAGHSWIDSPLCLAVLHRGAELVTGEPVIGDGCLGWELTRHSRNKDGRGHNIDYANSYRTRAEWKRQFGRTLARRGLVRSRACLALVKRCSRAYAIERSLKKRAFERAVRRSGCPEAANNSCHAKSA